MPDTTSPYSSLDDQLAVWQARSTTDQPALAPEARLALAARLREAAQALEWELPPVVAISKAMNFPDLAALLADPARCLAAAVELTAHLHRDDLPADAYEANLVQASGYRLYVTVFAQALVHVMTWGLVPGNLPAERAERLWDMASSALSALYALGRREGEALPPAFSEE